MSTFLGISSVHDLADQKDIKYGTVSNSAVQEFFASQTTDVYKKMYNSMLANKGLVNSSAVGIKKVRNSYGKAISMFMYLV